MEKKKKAFLHKFSGQSLGEKKKNTRQALKSVKLSWKLCKIKCIGGKTTVTYKNEIKPQKNTSKTLQKC